MSAGMEGVELKRELEEAVFSSFRGSLCCRVGGQHRAEPLQGHEYGFQPLSWTHAHRPSHEAREARA